MSILRFLKKKVTLLPSYTIGVGKWITPAYALRLQVGGYALNGMSTSEGLYLRDPQTDGSVYGPHDPVIDNVTVRPDGTYRHYLRYVNAHADFMVSLSRLLFRSQGKFDVLPAVGFGYAHAFAYRGTANTNSLTANFSVAAKYSVLKCMDVNLEIASALMPDHFDGRITGRKCYDNGNCIYSWYSCRYSDSNYPESSCSSVSMWRFRCSRRITSSDPDGMLSVRNFR